jgi:hypothetical protein
MKTALAMILTALATVAILRTSASRAPQPSGQVAESQADASIVGPVAASPISQAPSWPTSQVTSSPTGDLPPASAASPAPVERSAPPQPQGGTRTPRLEPVSDVAPDAGTPAPAMPSPTDAQLAALKAQVAALEQLVAQSRLESQQLGQINAQLQAQRQQVADAEAQQQDAAEQEAAQQAATLEALGTLRQAQVLLAFGNSDGVDEQLRRAEAALSGKTLLNVEAAREALSREDLYPARYYLAAALAERRLP